MIRKKWCCYNIHYIKLYAWVDLPFTLQKVHTKYQVIIMSQFTNTCTSILKLIVC
jgi:hypothetical protein